MPPINDAVLFLLAPQIQYKTFLKTFRGNFTYTSDSPFFHTARHATSLIDEVSCLVSAMLALPKLSVGEKKKNQKHLRYQAVDMRLRFL